MLVVAIVGLLAAIALPRFANLVDKSVEAASKGNLGTLRSACAIYYADNEGLYPWTVPYQSGGVFIPDHNKELGSLLTDGGKYLEFIPPLRFRRAAGPTAGGTHQTGNYFYTFPDSPPNDGYPGWAWIPTRHNDQPYVYCDHTDTQGVTISLW